MTEISRGELLHQGAKVGIGIIVGALTVPGAVAINIGTEKATGVPTGNAGAAEEIDQICEEYESREECYENFEYPLSEKIEITPVWPVIEEVMFRKAPSEVLNESNPDGVSRRNELLLGLLTSAAFAGLHNLTSTGFATNRIPASHFVDGMVYWYLQRKVGFTANATAHSVHNSPVWFL